MNNFISKLAEYDLYPESIIISDKIQRFKIKGSSGKAGWYFFQQIGSDSYGGFGDWQRGISEPYTSFQPGKTEKEIKKITEDFERIKKESESLRIKEAEAVAIKAQEMWAGLKEGSHPYLTKKKIKAHGARRFKNSLVVPICKNGQIVSLQFIDSSGKRFMSGGVVSGGAYTIKGSKEYVVICEGFSTGASVFEATGHQVFIAFNAGNLCNVAARVKEILPNSRIIIAGDDDKYKKANAGIIQGTKAANKSKARLVTPKFKNEETKPTDFNDLHVLEGLKMVEDQINAGEKSLKLSIKKWLASSPGEFSCRDIDHDLNIQTIDEKKARLETLERLVAECKLERVGPKRGYYRPYQADLIPLDYESDDVDIQFQEFWLPFKLHDYAGILPGNIIIIAGAPNAGKTALVMNLIKNNRNNFTNIDYFNSEVDKEELKLRLKKFDININDWGMKAWKRSENFSDVIRPGRGNLNVIDYLEVHDEFYKVGEYIKNIHAKLDGAVAIIALQKNAGQDNGLGGFRTMEKARLAISMDNGKMKITKAKNFKTEVNPNGFIAEFSLAGGAKFYPAGKSKSGGDVWYKES